MKTVISLLFLFSTAILFSTTLYINQLEITNPDLHIYNTIGEAYAAAINADTLIIFPGDYHESNTINKSLSIIGSTQNSSRIITNNQVGFDITTANVYIKNLVFLCAGSSGIRLSSNTPDTVIDNCLFDSCSTGVYIATRAMHTINNSVIRSCDRGTYVNTTSSSMSGSYNNCIFHDNTTAAVAFWASYGSIYDIDIYNCIFINNPTCFTKNSGATYSGTIAYNVFFNYTTLGGLDFGAGNIFDDPGLTNVTGTPYYNYFLLSDSPCIDSGDPNVIKNDLDGTRNDMGIFGGPHQWGDGNPTVLDINISPDTVQQGGTFNIEAAGQVK